MADPGTFGTVVDRQNKGSFNSHSTNNAKSIKELAYKTYIVASEQSIIVEAWLPETFMLDVNAKYEAPYEQGIGALGAMQGLSEMARFLGLSLTTQAMTAQVWQGGSFIDLSIPLVFQAETDAGRDVMFPIKQLLSLTMPKDPSGGGFLTAPGPRIDINKLASNGLEGVTKAFTDVKDSLGKVIGALATPIDTGKKVVNGNSGFIQGSVDTANNVARSLSSALVNSVVNNISLYVGKFLYFPSVVITDVSPTYDVILGPDMNPLRASVNVGLRTFYMPTSSDIDLMFPSTLSLDPTAGYGYGTSTRKGM